MGTVTDITSARSLDSSSDQQRMMWHYDVIKQTIEKFAGDTRFDWDILDILHQRHFVLRGNELGSIIVVVRHNVLYGDELHRASHNHAVRIYSQLRLVTVSGKQVREHPVCNLAELDQTARKCLQELRSTYIHARTWGHLCNKDAIFPIVHEDAYRSPTSA